MRPSSSGRVEAVYDAELAAVTDEVLVLQIGDHIRVGVPATERREVAPTARAAGADALDPDWWRALLGARVRGVDSPSLHLFTDREPPSAPFPLVEQVAPWRLARLRDGTGELEWRRSGLARRAEVFFGRFSEPLDPPAWMERATPAARRIEVSAAANLADWDGSPADIGVLTHPDHRRRDHGYEVAAVATAQAVRECGLARWRVEADDTPALALARALGFEPWATVLRVALVH